MSVFRRLYLVVRYLLSLFRGHHVHVGYAQFPSLLFIGAAFTTAFSVSMVFYLLQDNYFKRSPPAVYCRPPSPLEMGYIIRNKGSSLPEAIKGSSKPDPHVLYRERLGATKLKIQLQGVIKPLLRRTMYAHIYLDTNEEFVIGCGAAVFVSIMLKCGENRL